MVEQRGAAACFRAGVEQNEVERMITHSIGLADQIRHIVNVAGATHVEIRLTAAEAIKVARAVELGSELLADCKPVGTVAGKVESGR